MDIVAECRRILSEAKPANDNQGELRLLPQKGVDLILQKLNDAKPRGHVYDPEGFSEAAAEYKIA